MRNRAITLAAVAAVIAAVACSSDATITPVSKIVTFKATMNGASESPTPNASSGTGTFTATLDTATNIFTYDLTFTGLNAGVTAGHIHGPAGTSASAGTTINFGTLAGATFSLGATSGTGRGTSTLNAANQITASVTGDSLRKLMFAGLTYVNIHTTTSGSGEIRGQIIKQ